MRPTGRTIHDPERFPSMFGRTTAARLGVPIGRVDRRARLLVRVGSWAHAHTGWLDRHCFRRGCDSAGGAGRESDGLGVPARPHTWQEPMNPLDGLVHGL
ncbi:hypothetical protein BIFDEN_02250 [Bifidobacterium dentium ATCC 27678]|nr:hypothetical protein BIFDEN_02250 [Bifidobacterium dentium ATCC 27678]